MFPHVLVIKLFENQRRYFVKTAVKKAGGYIISVYRLKVTVHNANQTVHANEFPYFTDLPVSLSFILDSRTTLQNSIQWKPPVIYWCNYQMTWSPLSWIQHLWDVPGFHSAVHIIICLDVHINTMLKLMCVLLMDCAVYVLAAPTPTIFSAATDTLS